MGDLVDDPFRAARLILTLRRDGVTDHDLLNALETTPRAAFVASEHALLADQDCVLPLPCGQTLPRTAILATMLQALRINTADRSRVLIIGGGSGFTPALVAQLAGKVYVTERFKTLVEGMEQRFADLDIADIEIRHSDGLLGWAEVSPFDRILILGGLETVPEDLLSQMTPAGICVAPIGYSTRQEIMSLDRKGQEMGRFGQVSLGTLIQGVSRAL